MQIIPKLARRPTVPHLVRANLAGGPVRALSVCSQHPFTRSIRNWAKDRGLHTILTV